MTGIFAVDVFIAILTAIVIFAIPALFITRLVIDWLYPSLSHITCNDIGVYLMSEIKSDLDKLRSAPMGDLKSRIAETRRLLRDNPKPGKWVSVPLSADEIVHLSAQKDFSEAAMSEMLSKVIALRIEERITGGRKVIDPAKDTEMGLGYGLANDDSATHTNQKPPCFLHACFRDKFPSDLERQEAIDKFIATIGDHGDTIFWRVRPELWEERDFTTGNTEYAAYFRFSVGHLPKA